MWTAVRTGKGRPGNRAAFLLVGFYVSLRGAMDRFAGGALARRYFLFHQARDFRRRGVGASRQLNCGAGLYSSLAGSHPRPAG